MIMLNDTWEEDYKEFVENNPMTLCSGLSYRGKTNRLAHAQHMNALVFDLDCVGKDELLTLFLRMGRSEERRVGKSVNIGRRSANEKKKKKKQKDGHARWYSRAARDIHKSIN